MSENTLISIFECMYLFVIAALAASLLIICIIDFVKDNPNTIFRRLERLIKDILTR